jgi:SAM-dependent methyltransferase
MRGEYQLTVDGLRANRLHFLSAAVELGLLEALSTGPRSTADLADALLLPDRELLEAYLRAGVAGGQLRQDRDGRWRLRGVQARMLALPGAQDVCGRLEEMNRYDSAVQQRLADHLRGLAPGAYLDSAAPAIARGSRSVQACVQPLLQLAAAEGPAERVLDIGCGDVGYLAEVLDGRPGARGTGVELDPAVAGLAREAVARRGLDDRVRVLQGDALRMPLDGPYDLILCLQMIYYLPPGTRPAFLARMRGLLGPGGRLVLAFLGHGTDVVSRHYDLIFRITDGLHPLPEPDTVTAELITAGFAQVRLLTLLPGQPMYGVIAQADGR